MEEKHNYAFIDGQNLNLGIRELGWKLDYRKFRVYLKEKYRVIKAYYFIGYIPGMSDLYASLQEAGYILIFKPTLKTPTGQREIFSTTEKTGGWKDSFYGWTER